MIARQSVWSDPLVQQLSTQFVAVADEVSRLQSGDDPECQLFQEIAEQGHYGGRTQPTSTRQGTYVATPSGVLLASVNSNDPGRIARMLQDSLARWEELSTEERLLAENPEDQTAAVRRAEDRYPEGGLVLRVNSRDLPREEQAEERPGRRGQRRDWHTRAWNQDYAWFRKEEARQLLPEQPEAGVQHEVPESLVRRLARHHLVDNVRGQTSPFRDRDVERARLTAEVTSVEGNVVSLRLEGETRTVAQGRWSVAGFRDLGQPSRQERGYDAQLLGRAKFDLDQGRFLEFDMVALGDRWGATQYNGRSNDMDPSPMGVAFTLAGDSPAERVAPAFIYAYGW